MADDYSTLQTRIANELNRTDLSTEIQDAIQSAVAFYSGEHFYFSEKRAYRIISEDDEFVGLPDDFEDFIILTITVDNNYKYKLYPRTFQWIEDTQTNPDWTSRPTDFALWNDQIRLYPISDGSYTLNLAYHSSQSSLSANADSNGWTTVMDGEELIRLHAKVDILENIIRGQEAIIEARLYRGREAETLKMMREKTTMRLTTNTVKPTAW
jgi:hypothetical protein